MNIAVEEHWHNLLRAMGREDLREDPRFADNAARVANRVPSSGQPTRTSLPGHPIILTRPSELLLPKYSGTQPVTI
jgi:hypothetical protein